MIIVLGEIEAKPEHLDQVLALSLEHVQRSRTEPGCLSHDVSVDAQNPQRLMFTERWESLSALQAHFTVPESRAFVQTVAALAVSLPTLHTFQAELLER